MFFAVWPPEAVRNSLWRALAPTREAAPYVRWVPPERYHVTLRFLGDVAPARMPRLAAAADALASESVFAARIDGTGAFPRRGAPLVHWVGVRADSLRRLRRRLDESLLTHGVPRSGERFSPHLTVGRSRKGRRAGARSGREMPEPLPELDQACPGFVVDAVHLVRSQLLPTGPRYANIHRVRLSPSPRRLRA